MSDPLVVHETILFMTEPTPLQRRLYESPASHGFSSKEPSEEVTDALLALAISRVFKYDQTKESRIEVMAAHDLQAGLMARWGVVSRQMFNRIHEENPDSDQAQRVLKIAKNWFVRMNLRTKVLTQIPNEWVSYGFSRSEPLPPWMREGLLDL